MSSRNQTPFSQKTNETIVSSLTNCFKQRPKLKKMCKFRANFLDRRVGGSAKSYSRKYRGVNCVLVSFGGGMRLGSNLRKIEI